MPIIEAGFPQGLPSFNPPMGSEEALVRLGPTVMVEVGFDPALFAQNPPLIQGAMKPPAAIPAVQAPALLDTGAQESSIDEELARRLRLPLIDRETRAGISGPIVLNVYLAHLTIPNVVTQYGRFTGVHLQKGGQYHQALIGRTLLTDMLVIYDGRSGTVKLAR